MRKTDPPLIPQPVFMLFGKQSGGKLQRWKVEICPRFLCGRAVAYTAPVHKQMWSLSAGNQPVQGPQPHTARNVLIKYSLQISHLGWCCFFSLHCFGLVNMERRREGRRERRWEVETRGHILTPVRPAGCPWFWQTCCYLVLLSVGSGPGASSRLMFEFGCSPELRPGMRCREDKGAVNHKTAKLQINSREVSRFIARSQRNFPALKKKKRLNGMWQRGSQIMDNYPV